MKELGEDEAILRGFSHSFAHRRAALAYGRLGAREKALEHWSAFLEAFTDPDPDLAWMVEEARAGASLNASTMSTR